MMDEQKHSEQNDHEAARTPAPEVHRERELIVTDSGRRGSGGTTAIVVIFAIVALAILGFLAITFLQGDGEGIVPDEIDITMEVPSTDSGS